jgi:glycosyltransferase involved in cell wall biosynthesis
MQQAALLAVKDPGAAAWVARAGAARFSRSRIWLHTARALRVAGTAISADYAERQYWNLNDKFWQIHQAAMNEQVDLWLANDWTTLPIARRLARDQRVPFAYDTHELAIDEYAEQWIWRLTRRPVIAAIEGLAVREAAFVSCVSDGIAERLAQFYRLGERPLVVRNTPRFERIPFRATGDGIRVLYHGLVCPGRGLEACIMSVGLWRPEFTLTIRGPGTPDYVAHLARMAKQHRIDDRVTFAPAVPMTNLVQSAAEYDVGLFALPDHSWQNVYVLPNKFFEYMMAGLALCVSDLPEMTAILGNRQLGVLIEAVTPEAIAVAINSLDRTTIDRYKHNALAASRDLNWESEGRPLLKACERAVLRLNQNIH